jgi:CheY-like chemotaxis protein
MNMPKSKPPIEILVVDDDEIDVMHVERELSKLNLPIQFQTAHDGVEALTKLTGKRNNQPIIPPKIIVLDLMMPKMNGLEFLKALRKQTQFTGVSIFVLTTSNNEKDKCAIEAYKVDGYFVKDTQFQEFIHTCKNVLTLITRSN